ncbi:hypothetical protein Q31b_12770 [Novipirellula aureliae]|uniref:Uncharacterized protein n=1 Tax=Novipirellula aureliae TaxID=2527966 RepID=A0A5C6E736_9BACT|nr:YdjY domain-containing protein [Novipirellula aureliae]TWU43747.1 hypothetical protein Q31b_12770 [Novipirellula aureliae]
MKKQISFNSLRFVRHFWIRCCFLAPSCLLIGDAGYVFGQGGVDLNTPELPSATETPAANTEGADAEGGDNEDPNSEWADAQDADAQDADAQDLDSQDPDALARPETPLEVLRKTFSAPPAAKSLGPDSRLWVDRVKKRVYVDGYVAINRGPLEMFACPYGTKEHESVVATIARPSQVHAALLAVGAKSGTPVRFDPAFLPPTGQRIRVWVTWRDQEKKFHAVDAREWVRDADSGKSLEPDWVFAGSGFWTDPTDNKRYYMADGGDMICVSNFSTAMMDIGAASSANAEALLYEPFTERIPEQGTLVRLVLVPIPVPTDKSPADAETNAKLSEVLPTEDILPLK